MARGASRYQEAASQGQLWTPALFKGTGEDLRLWVDPSDLATVQGNASGKVGTLLDKSGKGHNMANSTAAECPSLSLVSPDTAPRGGAALPMLSYPGTSAAMLKAALSATYTGTTLHLYTVMSMTGYGNSNARLFCTTTTSTGVDYDNTTSFVLNRSLTGPVVEIYRNAVGPTLPGGTNYVPENIPVLVEVIFSGSQRWLALNGEETSKQADSAAFGCNYFHLGQYPPTPSTTGNTWSGQIGETIVDVAPYNSRRRALIQGYLFWKWGIRHGSGSGAGFGFPAHTFLNRPPLIGD